MDAHESPQIPAFAVPEVRSLAGRRSVARYERIARHAAESGDNWASLELGLRLAARGDEAAAAEAFRPAAERWDAQAAFHLGVSLAATGRADEALLWHTRAADDGFIDAHINLGALLLEGGDVVAAEKHYRVAAEAGRPLGAANLMRLLMRSGRFGEAAQWIGALEDDLEVAVYAGESALELGDQLLGEKILERAVECGSTEAAAALGVEYLRSGRPDNSRPLLQAATAQGNARALGALAALAVADGDHVLASTLVKQLATTGETDLVKKYAEGMATSGDRAGAEEMLRLVAARDQEAAVVLGRLLLMRKAYEEAASWLESPAAAGLPDAALLLGITENERGNVVAAEHAFRQATEAGDGRAAHKLAMVREGLGDRAGAITWYKRGADAGESSSMFNLGLLYEEDGDVQHAEQWLSCAHDAGHPRAAFSLGLLAFNTNRYPEALNWWRLAQAAGDERASANLAALTAQGMAADYSSTPIRDPNSRRRWWSR